MMTKRKTMKKKVRDSVKEVTITNNQTPIEIALGVDENGMTTAKKLYEFLELNPSNYSKWIKSNITDNEFAEENIDYEVFVPNDENPLGGRPTMDYKLSSSFAKKLAMKNNSEKGELARKYFITIENKTKEMVVNRSQLSPQMQMLYGMLDGQAKLELEQKRQAEQIEKVESTVTTMKEIFTEPIGDWKNDINARVREISIKSGIDYQELYGQMYGELEMTAHCSLKRLQDNKRSRMEKAGNTKTAIKDGTTKIAIIHEKPQLKAIFENIVKRYAMKYCA